MAKRSTSTKRMVDETVHGYLVAALFAGTDDEGEPLDSNYHVDDFDAASVRKLRGQIVAWIRKNKSAISDYVLHRHYQKHDGSIYEHLGHDLYFTSCGHGTGFWDRDYDGHKEIGEKLTKAAKQFGEKWVYVGDDGKLHLG